jgi:hypothetical protein
MQESGDKDCDLELRHPVTWGGIKMVKTIMRFVSFGGACCLMVFALSGTAAAVPGNGVPEIDPATLGAGVALLSGAGLLLIERYRRR